MNTVFTDLRYALRVFRKNSGFTAVAVITLALGIGANTSIFSVINGVLINPLPYPQPDQLVALYSRTPQFDKSSISYPNFLDWVRENHTLSALAAYRENDFNLSGVGEPERVPAEMVSASFFPLLGVKPVLGRVFTAEEDQLGAAPVMLLSAGLWKRRFGSSPEVLGRAINLNGAAYTILGVIPSSFSYSGNNFHRSDVYVPIGQWSDPTFRDRRTGMGTNAVGRLKPGVTLGQAKADMDAVGSHLAEEYPEANKGTGITLLPLKRNVVGEIQPFLLLLLVAVGLVLLIACVNVANLLLARSNARTREFAVRTALGAGRTRLVRQLLTESVLLALAGGGLGLAAASWGLQAALRVLPEALPRAEEIRLDARVLLFTATVAVLAGILFGLTPALKASGVDIHETLKEGGRGSTGARHRAQSVFVVMEMALALVLLAGAGLMIRSLVSLWRVDPGFEAHGLMTFEISFPRAETNPAAIRQKWRDIHDKLAALPGIQGVSLTLGSRPLRSDFEVPFWLEGQPKPSTQAEMKSTLFYVVQPDYLKVMRIPLKRGRFLSPQDDRHSRFVTVIDDRFAQLYFRGQDPIGKRVNLDILNASAEVIGIAGHVKQWGLASDSTSTVQAQCYLALSQIEERFLPLVAHNVSVVIRTAAAPEVQLAAVRQALNEINKEQVMYDAETMDAIISDSLAAQRFSMALLGVFASLAVVMASIGIYGVISYLTGRRTHEIGIRMALGAEGADVVRLVVGQGFRLILAGVAAGILGAFGLTRFAASLLYGIKPEDPLTFLSVSAILIFWALLACYIPARRATKIDPTVALRYE